jgi:hypothetical protein
MKKMSLIPLLTAVIPVTRMSGKLEDFKSTVAQCKELGVGLVVVHDMRDSETGPQLKSLIEHSGPINSIYLEDEYGSAAAARNAGLKQCKSRWVAFWDSDDTVYVNQFLKMVHIAEHEKSDLAIGKISVKSSERNSIAAESPSLFMNKTLDLQISNFPAFTRMSFRKSILEEDPFPEIHLGEDLMFLLSTSLLLRKITLINEVVYRYQVGDASQATKRLVGDAPYILLLTKMAMFLRGAEKSDKRLSLAFVDKLWLSLIRKALRGEVSLQGIMVMCKVAMYNLRYPIKASQILHFFLTNRPSVVGVIRGK